MCSNFNVARWVRHLDAEVKSVEDNDHAHAEAL